MPMADSNPYPIPLDCAPPASAKFKLPNPYPTPLDCVPPTSANFKLPPRKVVEEKLPSSYSGYHYMVKEHIVDIDHKSWIKTVRQRLNEVHPNFNPSKPCTIFKFPEKLRLYGDDGKEYGPVVVSIGPYHNFPDPRGTMKAMQDHKWRCVRHLLSRHRNQDRTSQLLDKCLIALKSLDSEVRSCYSDNLYYMDPRGLASIMLMDGCFIIHLMLKQVENERIEVEEEAVVVVGEVRKQVEDGKGKAKVEQEDEKVQLEMGKGGEEIEGPLLGMLWIWNLVTFDLLKLENQIPFFVIQTVFDIIRTPRDNGLNLVNLALGLFHDIHPSKSKAFTTMPTSQIHHLLHLFHSSLVPCKRKSSKSTAPEWIPSAMDLKRSGVRFVKKEIAEWCLDVSFDNGRIEIPPLQVYDYSKSLFQNLTIFEQCFPNVGKYVTNYAKFMQCVISSVEDVELLSSKGIVVNRLGTDELVADLFKQHNLQYASDGNYLADVFIQVKKYHGSSWRRWRAQLIHNYFIHPWAVFTLIAIALLFLLMAEESFFAAFSYFRPQ